MSTPASLAIEYAFTLHVHLAEAIDFGTSAEGDKRFIGITGGHFEGPKANGTILAGGGDWNTVREDGVVHLLAKYSIRTDDGTVISTAARLSEGQEGQEWYTKTWPRFVVEDGKYSWLRQACFVGNLRRPDRPSHVKIDVFELVPPMVVSLNAEPILPTPDFDLGHVDAASALRAKVIEVKEAGRQPPPFPFIFFKPTTTVIGHNEAVVIPKIAQDKQADYEGELCIVVGRDAKDVSIEDALSYVAACTVGNDSSSRKLQCDPSLAGRIPEWGFSKAFDTFAPLGPVLVASQLIADPSKLRLTTSVNSEKRQDEAVSDLFFDCAYLISYLSSGTTLQGSVIMTGTPGGVGFGLDPPQWLRPGDKVEVSISEIGTLRNTVEYA
ncbi:fumarylacetoacetate hydrolase-like protein 2 [Elsinoe australis]|uniref:Fumarylacetoacetate hydrolase-like protein 2 n=1 Tax=Elsinoe australis TaxID=40998 RepID=A0A4U7AS92_9PEZI|nr:fumarylacetoacetate hydrolase-like protein 2 [Elsinoe australis]